MRQRAFTIIELLVVVSIIALLIGILLPAIGKARDQAKLTQSQANLRNLAAAHQSYAATWNDRQFTLVADTLGAYPGSNMALKGASFNDAAGEHPPISLGWAPGQGGHDSGGNRLWGYWMDGTYPGNFYLLQPIAFGQSFDGFGWFRFPNAAQFNQYVGDRFYDNVFYAPKDTIVIDYIQPALNSPGSFYSELTNIGYSSYCLSPAALYSPGVLRPERPDGSGGFQDPMELPGAFRCPSFSQALYPDLKTHMLEHHWLQQRRAECNPAFTDGEYDGCEPYYFNHGWESVPMTLFFDGHIEGLGVREAEKADSRSDAQAGHGLWSRDTTYGEDGYFIDYGYDFANTSFHILTTDGIRGRDKVADG